MNKITLQKVHSTGPGFVHVKILINNKDVGILYLKDDEAEVLINYLKRGAAELEAEFDSDIFDTEDDYNLDEEE